MWKFFDEKPSVSFYKSDMETEIFCMKLTFKNIILILNAILFFFFVIVALYGEFIR